MILSDKEILKALDDKTIVIEPFSVSNLGSNSYDVHLGPMLGMYKSTVLDAKKHNEIRVWNIPEEGFLLQPGDFYLGTTLEYTESHEHVPFLEGKSSTGRLGIDIHATAGKGDIGFCGNWTLEISVKVPVVVYSGMPIGQLIYFTAQAPQIKYSDKDTAKYGSKEVSFMPVESMMWKNFPTEEKKK